MQALPGEEERPTILGDGEDIHNVRVVEVVAAKLGIEKDDIFAMKLFQGMSPAFRNAWTYLPFNKNL